MNSEYRNLYIFGGIVAAIVILLLVLFVPTHEIKVEVTDTLWVHEQQVENYIPRSYTDWQESVPSDGYDRHPYQAIRYWQSIPTGESCSTDRKGYESCHTTYTSIPVYGTKVDYTADRWGYERSQVVRGNNNQPLPFWPTPDFQACDKLSCERSGNTTERYVVTYIRDDKSTFTCDTTRDLYGEFRNAQWYNIQDGSIIHIPRCDTLIINK